MSEYVLCVLATDMVTVAGYIASYDPDFVPSPPNPPYPSGLAAVTDDIAEAMRFPSWKAGMDAWCAQSRTVPLRPDGKPNRPLTAAPIECIAVPA